MPIYEFVCENCQHRFEKLLSSMRLRSTPPCPECHGPTSKSISVFAAHAHTASAPCGSASDACNLNQQDNCPGGSCPYSG